MPFQYKKILVLGATSGIGQAFAERFIAEGSRVIVSGRRTERLEEFVQKYGSDKASSMTLDTTQLDKIPSFVSEITNSHPDLDCIMLNSGLQRVFDFSKPDTVDMSLFENEMLTNYISLVHLTHAFIPFFQKKSGGESAIMFTSSLLGIVPLFRCPGYSATKAAMHSFAMSLREQLQESKIKVVELMPPAVQTELHDYMPSGRSVGIPLKQYIDSTYEKLAAGDDQPIVHAMVPGADEIAIMQRENFAKMTASMKARSLP